MGGPKPGTHHAGTFKGGPDPRRCTTGPRPRGDLKAVRDYARQFTIEAIDLLVSVMRDEDARHVVRMQAADSILDRGIGRPTVRVGEDDETPVGLGLARSEMRAALFRAIGVKDPPVTPDEPTQPEADAGAPVLDS